MDPADDYRMRRHAGADRRNRVLSALAANVAVAEQTATGRVIAAWPSFALIASHELLMRQVRRATDADASPQQSRQSRSRPERGSMVGTSGGVGWSNSRDLLANWTRKLRAVVHLRTALVQEPVGEQVRVDVKYRPSPAHRGGRFLAFARGVAPAHIFDAIRDADPLDDICAPVPGRPAAAV